jgi:hypothetical protein
VIGVLALVIERYTEVEAVSQSQGDRLTYGLDRAIAGPKVATAMTWRFSANPRPVAHARGSVQSRDCQRAVCRMRTNQAVEDPVQFERRRLEDLEEPEASVFAAISRNASRIKAPS